MPSPANFFHIPKRNFLGETSSIQYGGAVPPITAAVYPLLHIVSLGTSRHRRWAVTDTLLSLPTDFPVGLAYS